MKNTLKNKLNYLDLENYKYLEIKLKSLKVRETAYLLDTGKVTISDKIVKNED